MPLPADFEEVCLYRPDAWFLVDAEIDVEGRRVVGTCDTTKLGQIVDAQRTWPGHPKHFPGAVAIQITGTLGQLLSNYVLGLRSTEGWVGFGTHIHDARFPKMGVIGPPVTCEGKIESVRRFRQTVFIKIAFCYTQDGEDIYVSHQTAAFFQTEHRGPLPEESP